MEDSAQCFFCVQCNTLFHLNDSDSVPERPLCVECHSDCIEILNHSDSNRDDDSNLSDSNRDDDSNYSDSNNDDDSNYSDSNNDDDSNYSDSNNDDDSNYSDSNNDDDSNYSDSDSNDDQRPFITISDLLQIRLDLIRRIRSVPYRERSSAENEELEQIIRRKFRQVLLSQDQIDKLSTITVSKDDASCVICIDDFTKDEKALQLPCNHFYHKNCIQEWLLNDARSTCPTCRQPVNAS